MTVGISENSDALNNLIQLLQFISEKELNCKTATFLQSDQNVEFKN